MRKVAVRPKKKANSARKPIRARERVAIDRSEGEQALKLAQLHIEKCELKEAREGFQRAFLVARAEKNLRLTMEAVSGLLRVAGEAMDHASVERLRAELDRLVQKHPKQVPAVLWYNLAAVHYQLKHVKDVQRYVLRCIKALKAEKDTDALALAKGWMILVGALRLRGRLRRAELLAHKLLERFESRNFRGVNGYLYTSLGAIHEARGEVERSRAWYEKAHLVFLSEHNWYFHLYILYAYARLARMQRNYKEAYWNLRLVEQAVAGTEFGILKHEVELEKARLEADAVDLLVDSRECYISTREQGNLPLGKQYVLLQILEALTQAHQRGGEEKERGLSKAEIIKSVWKEDYRPESHDNKLYYNINRLRRIIEPDVKNPKYLLNWKEGYRLAPGLKVHFIGGVEDRATPATNQASNPGGMLNAKDTI